MVHGDQPPALKFPEEARVDPFGDAATAFGRDLRRLTDRARASVLGDLAEVSGLTEDELAPFSDLFLGAILAGVESVLDRRASKPVAIAAGSRMITTLLASVPSLEAVAAE